jgi:hypothetical protein
MCKENIGRHAAKTTLGIKEYVVGSTLLDMAQYVVPAAKHYRK